MKFNLPELPYAYNALEPYMDEATLHFHHDKHHAAYCANFNLALEGLEGDLTVEQILSDFSQFPEAKRPALRNNGGGFYNHNLFWSSLAPNAGGAPVGELAEAITAQFGSFEAFKEQFSNAAKTRFGSGWAWLTVNNGKLEVLSTANQDSPLELGKKPLLLLDVWEHAYYLNYQNRRPDYVEAFWNLVNWEEVNNRYLKFK